MDACEKKALVEKWYHQYANYLFHAARLLGPANQAEELVQETFRVVLEKDDLDEVTYPKTWLRKILYNVVRNQLRLQSNSESSLTGSASRAGGFLYGSAGRRAGIRRNDSGK